MENKPNEALAKALETIIDNSKAAFIVGLQGEDDTGGYISVRGTAQDALCAICLGLRDIAQKIDVPVGQLISQLRLVALLGGVISEEEFKAEIEEVKSEIVSLEGQPLVSVEEAIVTLRKIKERIKGEENGN